MVEQGSANLALDLVPKVCFFRLKPNKKFILLDFTLAPKHPEMPSFDNGAVSGQQCSNPPLSASKGARIMVRLLKIRPHFVHRPFT